MRRPVAWLAIANGALLLVPFGLAVAVVVGLWIGHPPGPSWLGPASILSLACVGLVLLGSLAIAVDLAFIGPSRWGGLSVASLAGLMVAIVSLILAARAATNEGQVTLSTTVFLFTFELGVGIHLLATNTIAAKDERLGTVVLMAGFIAGGLFLVMAPLTLALVYDTVLIAIAAILAWATWSVAVGVSLMRNPFQGSGSTSREAGQL